MDKEGNFRVAVIGYGYWGPNLVRNFSTADGAVVSHICDLSAERLKMASRAYPSAAASCSLDVILADETVDIVAIATPVRSHYDLAIRALEAGKHVLVEKPLAASSAEARSICASAERNGRQVFIDHTFVFTPAVRKMRELLHENHIGLPLYYDSIRINLGIFQHDCSVIWDLVSHDVAILDFLLDGRLPRSVTCTGVAHFGGQHADLAYVTLKYSDDFIAHINANWLAPKKIRQVILCGDRRMVVYDDNATSEKIKVYDNGVDVTRSEDIYDLLIQYRTGDMHAPRLNEDEALALEVRNVLGTMRNAEKAVCDGAAGLRVVAILEAAEASLRLNGNEMLINPAVINGAIRKDALVLARR